MDMNEKSDLIKSLMEAGDKRSNKTIVLGTHSGECHADDVLATVVLLHELKPLGYNVQIIRSRNINYLNANCDIVYDVGHGKYDHHDDYKVLYPNGVKMAACGKILNDVIMDQEVLENLRARLFYGVEAQDNGQELPPGMEPSKLGFVSSFNPTWGEDRSDKGFYKCFMQVLPLVGNIYERILNMVYWDLKARDYVKEHGKLIMGDHFMLLDRYCPTFDYAKFHPDFYGTVYPSENQWSVRFAPTFQRKYETRIRAPRQLCSKHDEELQQLTGIKSARFCHPAGFLVVFDDQEGALKFLENMGKGVYDEQS